MTVTIRDVANAAGVSTATVSNVLNKTGKVGPKTQKHVLSTVKRLGYVPDVHARRLASNNRRTLGIIVSDIENPFFPEIIKSFETRARELGYDAILGDTNYEPRRTQEAADGTPGRSPRHHDFGDQHATDPRARETANCSHLPEPRAGPALYEQFAD